MADDESVRREVSEASPTEPGETAVDQSPSDPKDEAGEEQPVVDPGLLMTRLVIGEIESRDATQEGAEADQAVVDPGKLETDRRLGVE